MNKKIALIFSAAILAIGLCPLRTAAIDFKQFEDVGLESIWAVCVSSQASGGKICNSNTSSQQTVGVSSWTIPGWMTQYQIGTVGGNAQFNIQTSTDNWMVGGEYLQGTGYGGADYYTSSTVYVSSAIPLLVVTHGQAYNTIVSLTELDNGASIYMRINYLLPRSRNQP